MPIQRHLQAVAGAEFLQLPLIKQWLALLIRHHAPCVASLVGFPDSSKTMDSSVLETASELVMGAVDPISDFRGSAEYRTAMVGELFARAMNAALLRSRDQSVAVGYV